jgi:hypothetical protein
MMIGNSDIDALRTAHHASAEQAGAVGIALSGPLFYLAIGAVAFVVLFGIMSKRKPGVKDVNVPRQ